MNFASELWHVIQLWMTVNIKDVQMARSNGVLLQECYQVIVSPFRTPAPLSHQENDAALN